MRAVLARMQVAVVALAVLLGSAIAGVAGPQAAALTPGVSFSADELPTWQTDGVVWALGQVEGKVIAGGSFSQLRPPRGSAQKPRATSALAILDAETGEPDECQLAVTYNEPGLTPTVRAIAAAPDGTVYIGGDFSAVAGVYASRLAAIDLKTCTVKPFRFGSVSSIVRVLALHEQTLYVGGDFATIDRQPRARFAAVDARSGDLLPWQVEADQSGRAIAVSPDGRKVAVGGNFTVVNGVHSRSLAVVDGTTGLNLRTFGDDFTPPNTTTTHIWSSPSTFYTSSEGVGAKAFDGRIAIDWDTLTQVWRDNCRGATQATIEYFGTLYSASHSHDCSANGGYQQGRRNFFNAQSASTAALLGWDPRANDGIGEGIGPRALTIAFGSRTGSPYLWAGGEFTAINGGPQQGLTRFGTNDVGAPPTPRPVAQATDEGSIQVRWLTVVDADDARLTYEVYRNGSSRPIWQGYSTSVWWQNPQMTFVDRKVRRGRSYTYRVRASDSSQRGALSPSTSAVARNRATTYAATVRMDRPVLYWDSQRTDPNASWLQDVGAATSSSSRLQGRVAGGVTQSSNSPLGVDATGSLFFDGYNDFVWNNDYSQGPRAYSIEAWFKTRSRKGGGLVGYGDGRPRTDSGARLASKAGRYDRVVYLTNKGKVQFGVDGGKKTVVKSRRTYRDGRWHHAVATQDRRGMRLYVDGKRVGRNSVTRSGDYLGVWHVGGDRLTGYASQPRRALYRGLIDEVAIYPGALSRARVLAHFKAARRARN